MKNKMPCKALNLTCVAFWHDRQYNDTMKNKAAKNTLIFDDRKEGDNNSKIQGHFRAEIRETHSIIPSC